MKLLDLSYCKLRPDALRGLTLSWCISGKCFYCQVLVTVALHTFPSLEWPRPESVFKYIQTPAGCSFVATGALECCWGIWTAANNLVSMAMPLFVFIYPRAFMIGNDTRAYELVQGQSWMNLSWIWRKDMFSNIHRKLKYLRTKKNLQRVLRENCHCSEYNH